MMRMTARLRHTYVSCTCKAHNYQTGLLERQRFWLVFGTWLIHTSTWTPAILSFRGFPQSLPSTPFPVHCSLNYSIIRGHIIWDTGTVIMWITTLCHSQRISPGYCKISNSIRQSPCLWHTRGERAGQDKIARGNHFVLNNQVLSLWLVHTLNLSTAFKGVPCHSFQRVCTRRFDLTSWNTAGILKGRSAQSWR
jgi:hypothetical protein